MSPDQVTMRPTHTLLGTSAVVIAFGAAFHFGHPEQPRAAPMARAMPISTAAAAPVPSLPKLGGAVPALAKPAKPRRPHKRGRATDSDAPTAIEPRAHEEQPTPATPGGTAPVTPRRHRAPPARRGPSGGDDTADPQPFSPPPAATPVPRPREEIDPGTVDGTESE